MLKENSVVCFWSEDVILVSVKSSFERWNKSSVLYVHVVWFGINGKVSPRYFGLF